MERILSERGAEHILSNGYCYRLDRKLRNERESWRCTQDTCRGQIHVHESSWDEVMPQPATTEMKKKMANVREKASSCNDVQRRTWLVCQMRPQYYY